MHQSLLSQIDDFLAATGLSEHRFGILAAKNGRLVERLRKNGRIWPDTEAKVRSFIRSERNKRAAAKRGARSIAPAMEKGAA